MIANRVYIKSSLPNLSLILAPRETLYGLITHFPLPTPSGVCIKGFTRFLGVVSGDNHVFAFLLAVEKMMNNGAVSREEWQLFTQLPINSQAERALDGDIPKWVSRKVWEVRH